MSIDEQHVALPKLYGAPAYARPPRTVGDAARPLDADDLPIAAFQTAEEREAADMILGRRYGPARYPGDERPEGGELRPRPFRLRALATRILHGN
ncbi:MAG TPA: hypothetical protein VM344_06605 [Vitreimonas sp.]|nr:hypothetical protein [Vitreimonas sp.]